MIARLGFRLAIKGGKEAITRLLLMTVAVALGSSMVLFTLAGFHGLRMVQNRPCWECTRSETSGGTSDTQHTLLWLFRQDYYNNQQLERADMAALGNKAPMPPGISQLPLADEYYASPELAKLIDAKPKAQLGERFPATRAGIISDSALSDPKALVAYVGHTPAQMETMSHVQAVSKIATSPQQHTVTQFLQIVLGVGAVGLLFPMLILVSTATRLSASRREERFAALRLIGATPGQITVIASVDSLVASLAGVIVGLFVFIALRPLVAQFPFTGAPFFVSDLTPTLFGYLAVMIGVPIASVVTAAASLRRVQISPLGVSRKAMPKPPKAWRAIPFLIGLIIFTATLVWGAHKNTGALILVPLLGGFVLMLTGLILAGSWLTMVGARGMARVARGASSLLAARRLAYDPKAAFRSVSGLVLAVFIGTMFSTLAPAILGNQGSLKKGKLTDTVVATFHNTSTAGLDSPASTQLINKLEAVVGSNVYPIYATQPAASAPGNKSEVKVDAARGVISCAALAAFNEFSHCPAGAQQATIATHVVGDHMTSDLIQATSAEPLVANAAAHLQALLVSASSQDEIEHVRTIIINNGGATSIPQTYGEALQTRSSTIILLQRMVYAGIALTLFVAACSLSVSVGGSLVERKRPFSLLRLSGMSMTGLSKVILIESAVPLLIVSVLSGVAGYGTGALMIKVIASSNGNGTQLKPLSVEYYLTMLMGLIISVLVVSLTLPLLNKLTQSDSARFE
ncbi:MAG TPA: FtsX-like permease family protein [Candidatus Saccharimonadales bacterium]|nr:FtsX-like permease family protein [Candidatus Saccharimonadales bacterium]